MNSPADHHVGELLADYLADRLPDEQAASVESHLATCEECVEDLHFTRSLRARAVEQGEGDAILASVHLLERRIAELSDRGMSPTRHEQRHLEVCERCSNELGVLASVPLPDEVVSTLDVGRAPTREESTPWMTRAFGRWSWGILAAAAAVVFLVGPWRDATDLGQFAVVEAMPVRVPRGGEAETSFEQARRAGLQAYSDGVWSTAAAQLRIAAREDATAEVQLYLGSALLLDGDAESAIGPLESALSTDDPLLREEARWQLANAFLSVGDADGARAQLETLAAEGAGRAAQAEALLEQF